MLDNIIIGAFWSLCYEPHFDRLCEELDVWGLGSSG